MICFVIHEGNDSDKIRSSELNNVCAKIMHFCENTCKMWNGFKTYGINSKLLRYTKTQITVTVTT